MVNLYYIFQLFSSPARLYLITLHFVIPCLHQSTCYLPVCLSVCLSTPYTICLYVYLSGHSSAYPSTCLYVNLSVCLLPTCLCVDQSVCLSLCQSTQLWVNGPCCAILSDNLPQKHVALYIFLNFPLLGL